MVEVTLSNFVPNTVPAMGWKVGYRRKGSVGPYTLLGPYTALPIVFQTTDLAGTLYEGYVQSDCGELQSTQTAWTTVCNCNDGYQVQAGESGCQRLESIPADVSNAGFCLAPSIQDVYSQYESRVYNTGFSQATLNLPPGSSGGFIFGRSNTPGQWANPTLNQNTGPMNRAGVWIDSNCDGTRNPLAPGSQTTIAFTLNNLGPERVIYMGCGADNQFKVVVNGTDIVETVIPGDLQFKIWHIIPITVRQGVNYINMIGTGDGTANDSLGMVIYDNTPTQILAATNDSQLNILFTSASLRFGSYDVATCPPNYSLDTSGGAGNFICTRILTTVCNPAS